MGRSKAKALEAASREAIFRWRLLLRNLDFQADLAKLRSEYPGGYPHAHRLFFLKWKTHDHPFSKAFHNPTMPDLSPATIQDYERLTDPALSEAVCSTDPYNDFEMYISSDDDDRCNPQPALGSQPDRFLNITADLSYPLDILTVLIDVRLRQAKVRHDAAYADEKKRPRRLNLKALENHLQVYDLAMCGHTFASIAEQLRLKPSTVKSAYIAAFIKIYTDGPVVAPKMMALRNFNASNHLASCEECKTANSSEKMCKLFQLFLGLDTGSCREQLTSKGNLDHYPAEI